MATLLGIAFNYQEERRLDKMFKAGAFMIGSYYPETTFGSDTNIQFLKEQVYEMIQPAYLKQEEVLRQAKREQAKRQIDRTYAIDRTLDRAKLMKQAVDKIELELKNRSRMVKEKLFQHNSDTKIIKAANIGSACAMEVKSRKQALGIPAQKDMSLARKIAIMTAIAIMPYVMIDSTKEIIPTIKRGYNSLVKNYRHIAWETEKPLHEVKLKYLINSETKILEDISKRYAAGQDEDAFNKIANEHKGIEVKTNKPKNLNL